MSPRALVRRPSPRLVEGLITHISRSEVDVALALQQWEGYVAALDAAGWGTIEVSPADDCADSVFVEDTVVMYGDLAVISRFGADEREPEVFGTEVALRELDYIERIVEPGTLDDGDVLKHGNHVWGGIGGRTNAAGVAQLAALLGPEGAQVIGEPAVWSPVLAVSEERAPVSGPSTRTRWTSASARNSRVACAACRCDSGSESL